MTDDERPVAVSLDAAMAERAAVVAKVRASESGKFLAHLSDSEILDQLWADVGQPDGEAQ